jgi:hypothetical protein
MKSSFINISNHFITEKTKRNKAVSVDQMKKYNNHYFIMTEGGQPIYSRYGDEMDISGMLATYSAIITKFNYSSIDKLQDLQ